MANSAYNYDLPEGGAGPKTRPTEMAASGHHSHADAIEGIALDDAPQRLTQARAVAHRGKASGRYLPKDHVEARDVVSGCHLVIRDPRLVMSDQDRPYGRPANDWSQGASVSAGLHLSQCSGGNLCPAPSFHEGLSD